MSGDGTGIELLRALALVMVIEGLMPFAFPMRWRQTMLQASQMDPRVLRLIGLGSVVAGLVVLQIT